MDASTTLGGTYAVTSSSSNFFTASNTYVDVTNLSTSFTSKGRPVEIRLIPDGTAPGWFAASGTGLRCVGFLAIVRDGAVIAEVKVQELGTASGSEIFIPGSSVSFIDFVSAGTYTYKIQIKGQTASVSTAEVNAVKMVVKEV